MGKKATIGGTHSRRAAKEAEKREAAEEKTGDQGYGLIVAKPTARPSANAFLGIPLYHIDNIGGTTTFLKIDTRNLTKKQQP